MNITGYVQTVRKEFEELPFRDVDSLVLSQLSYYGFEHLQNRPRRVPLRELVCGHLEELTQVYQNPVPHAAFLNAIAESPRFGGLILTYFRLYSRPTEEKQFCAMTFLGKGEAYVVFRGTDRSLTGWKEDMNMSYSDSVPSQREAVHYLKMVAKNCPLPLIVGGHSKGGNLAVYASLFCGEGIQDRILAVYNHDGPGFRPAVLRQPAYDRMLDRIHKTMPGFSVFGMILSQKEPVKIVRSDRNLLMQHDPFSWQIRETEFETLPDFSSWSKKIGMVFNRWLDRYSDPDRKRFVDTLCFLLAETGYTDSEVVISDWKNCTRTLYASGQKLDPDTRKFMRNTMGSLIALSAKSFLFPVSPKSAELGRRIVKAPAGKEAKVPKSGPKIGRKKKKGKDLTSDA